MGILVLLASLVLAGCEQSPNILNPKGPVADREAGLFWFILVIATIVFVAVTGALLYSIIRFRDRPGAAAPRQFHGNSRLELAWTIVPSIVLFAVLVGTIVTMTALAEPKTSNVLTVEAIGHQWWWEFRYPGQNIVTADELHVPVGTTVHVDLRSDNVIHSFWIPQLAGKTDVIPGHNNSLWFSATTAGDYRGECAEFCGTQHANMNFRVVAEDQTTYNSWVAAQQAPAATAQTAQQKRGEVVFQRCTACHLVNGNPVRAGQIGPNLTHFGSRGLIAGGVLENNTTNLKLWIRNAQAVKEGNDMPAFPVGALPETDLEALVAYLQNLK